MKRVKLNLIQNLKSLSDQNILRVLFFSKIIVSLIKLKKIVKGMKRMRNFHLLKSILIQKVTIKKVPMLVKKMLNLIISKISRVKMKSKNSRKLILKIRNKNKKFKLRFNRRNRWRLLLMIQKVRISIIRNEIQRTKHCKGNEIVSRKDSLLNNNE